MAYRLTSPEVVSKIYVRHELGYELDLTNPKTFNEKLQWLKLYYWPNNEKAIQCADKYAVRKYMQELGYGEYLNELVGCWDSAYDIDWNALPNQFALKCNHGCGYNIICPDKSKLSENTTKKLLNKWMHEDFGRFNAEPHYDKISKKIVCEKFLGGEVVNYNIYCFNGKAIFFSRAGGLGDGKNEYLTYYKTDGNLADFKNRAYPTRVEALSPILPKMIVLAEAISKEFPMVRVDLFDIDGKIVLSELTFTPGGALIPFEPIESDRKLGNMLDIKREMNEFE